MVTQTFARQYHKNIWNQVCHPLCVLGEKHVGSKFRRSTYEEKAYAILSLFLRIFYVVCGPLPTHVHTDHRKQLYVFAPLALRSQSSRPVIVKIRRLTIFLFRFDFSISHISASQYVSAGMLARWSRGQRRKETNTVAYAGRIVPSFPAALKPRWFGWRKYEG